MCVRPVSLSRCLCCLCCCVTIRVLSGSLWEAVGELFLAVVCCFCVLLFGGGREKRENLRRVEVCGCAQSAPPGDRVMVFDLTREDVLEMRVLLAENPPKFSKGALRAGASRHHRAPPIS